MMNGIGRHAIAGGAQSVIKILRGCSARSEGDGSAGINGRWQQAASIDTLAWQAGHVGEGNTSGKSIAVKPSVSAIS